MSATQNGELSLMTAKCDDNEKLKVWKIKEKNYEKGWEKNTKKCQMF